jgi:hypothetical protein
MALVAASATVPAEAATAAPGTAGHGRASSSAGNWVKLSPALSPSPRYGSAFAFDPGTKQLMLYGGQAAGDYAANGTWSWNGKDWVRIWPESIPPGLFAAQMAYDAATHQMVLFGGWAAPGKANDETWNWTGTTWQRLKPVTSPPALVDPSIVWDASSSQLLLFGGANGGSDVLSSATWLWTGDTWRQLHPATSPAGELAGSMSYDPTTRSVLLFGGCIKRPSFLYTDATWNWNGTDRVKASPKVAPEARYAAGMAFDPVSDEMVLFGGAIDGGRIYYSGTWQWNGTTWAQLHPRTLPARRGVEMMGFDPATEQLVMFGGGSGIGQFLDDTWLWEP